MTLDEDDDFLVADSVTNILDDGLSFFGVVVGLDGFWLEVWVSVS